jgi:hypothetical protein
VEIYGTQGDSGNLWQSMAIYIGPQSMSIWI